MPDRYIHVNFADYSVFKARLRRRYGDGDRFRSRLVVAKDGAKRIYVFDYYRASSVLVRLGTTSKKERYYLLPVLQFDYQGELGDTRAINCAIINQMYGFYPFWPDYQAHGPSVACERCSSLLESGSRKMIELDL